jgi:hypothetical protein
VGRAAEAEAAKVEGAEAVRMEVVDPEAARVEAAEAA